MNPFAVLRVTGRSFYARSAMKFSRTGGSATLYRAYVRVAAVNGPAHRPDKLNRFADLNAT